MVYRDTLVDLKLSDYVHVPDTTVQVTVTLDSISLTTETFTERITLRQIAEELVAQGNPIGQTLLNNDGNQIPFVPPITGISSDTIAINASTYFQNATLLSGEIYIEIKNELPVPIDSVSFMLQNNGVWNDTVVSKTIYNIDTHTVAKDSADLAGKQVESQMLGKMNNLASGGAF
jgi:hypothetical protein